MTISPLVGTEKGPIVRAKINEVITEVNAGVGSGDMLASTYDPAGGARQVSFACTTQTAITDYTFTGSESRDSGYLVTTASNRTVNISPDLFTTGFEVTICKGTNNTNTVTLDAQTGNNINGTQTFVITQFNEAVTLLKDGADTWKIKSHYYPISGTNTGDNATNTTYTTLTTTLSTANTWSAIQTFLSGMFGLRNVANTFTSFFTNTNTASRTYTLQDSSDTLIGRATTDNLTNKRITKRIETVASSATPASNTDSYDITKITGLAVAITSLTSGLTGTPVDGDMHLWSFTDNGTARAITPGASFENSTVSFPTTTVISTRLDILCEWNSATSKWRVIATA